MTKSAAAAAARRFSMSGQGVSRSERLMAAKSCMSGAPSRAAQLFKAAMPGMTSMGMLSPRSLAISKTSPAMA